MAYKLLILAPSAGGKSTLMRYLRENTEFEVAESDEEVMKANDGTWPDNELKNKVLVPQTTKEVIARNSVIYLASYVPDELITKARSQGFIVALLDIKIYQLTLRNKKRMRKEQYQDASLWWQQQLEAYERLAGNQLIDVVLDGNQPVENLARQISDLANTNV